jgi:phospholipid-binding lipoprotein MlaA
MKLSGPINLCALVLCAALASGCASTGQPGARSNPDDPWEGFNRGTFAFNETLDTWVLKPVAKGYDAVTPGPVRVGVANFFDNLGDVWVGVNNLLQGKPGAALSDLGRFLVNSTMGVAGLIDVASPMGLERHSEDFGQTLAVWGAGSGPYVVLPVFGPRTVRDSGGLAFDMTADALNLFNHDPTRYGMTGLRLIDTRAGFLPTDRLLNEASLDKYAYLRSAYLQRRQHLIFDGNPPREEIPEE